MIRWLRCKSDCGIHLWKIPLALFVVRLFKTKNGFLLLRHWKGRVIFVFIFLPVCRLWRLAEFFPSPSGICISPRLRDCMWVFSAWFVSMKYNRDTLLGLPSIKNIEWYDYFILMEVLLLQCLASSQFLFVYQIDLVWENRRQSSIPIACQHFFISLSL